MQTFLDLKLADFGGKVPPHQVLKARGLLVDYDPRVHEEHRERAVGFVSHQWTSWTAADPAFAQLGVLKRFFERILAGDIQQGEETFLFSASLILSFFLSFFLSFPPPFPSSVHLLLIVLYNNFSNMHTKHANFLIPPLPLLYHNKSITTMQLHPTGARR